MRYADGVVMAGDRRATAGNLISHRTMDKVVEADRYSGVAIAGAAGPAMEMVRLFQLQLEHYEKVEGTALSLEGKANQLSMMIRGNLQAAMMGLAVVPIFAGYDLRRQVGRLWAYDVTGGRYEEREYVATGLGQPARRHGDQGRLPRRRSIARDAVDLVCRALWEAADADSRHRRARLAARHLPDRRHDHRRRLRRASTTTSWPTLRLRRRHRRRRCAARMTMPFYVAPEQVMKDRADYARKGIARGRALVAMRYADGIAIVAENSSETLRKISEIYDRIAFAGVGRYNEFDQLRVAGVRAADLKGFQYSRDDVDARSLANQYAQILGQIFTHEMKPMEVEILVAEVGLRPTATRCSTSSTTARCSTSATTRCSAATPTPSWPASASRTPTASMPAPPSAPERRPWPDPTATLPAADLEVALLARGDGAALLPPPHRRAGRRLPRLTRRRHRVLIHPSVCVHPSAGTDFPDV